MPEASVFPSSTWFERLAELMHADEPAFKDLGPVDCTMVVEVQRDAGGSDLFEVGFGGYGVKSIRRLASLAEAAPSHFVITAPLAAWREMIDNIHAHGAPDLEHTLNYLTLPDVPMQLSGPDQLEVDAFYRYNESLQRFFNGAVGVATSYPQ